MANSLETPRDIVAGKGLQYMDNKAAVERAEGKGAASMTAGGRTVGQCEPDRHHGGKANMGAAVSHLNGTPGITNPDVTPPHRGKMSR